jgi:hypothetical protein
MATQVTDPALLAQLNGPSTGTEVTDPALLAQLNGAQQQPAQVVQPQQMPSWLGASMAPGQQMVSTAAPAAPAAATPVAPDAPLNWSDVPMQAAMNAPGSAYQFGADIAHAVAHPIETGGNIASVGKGLMQKTGLMSGTDAIPAADAVYQFYVDRYGSAEGLKRALAKDPVGVLGDLSTVLSGGGGLAAKLPGLAGRVGEIAATAGRITDPLNAITKPAAAATAVASKVAGPLLSVPTGVGAGSLETARQAGREGGAASEALTSQMRGSAPLEDILTDARAAGDQMRTDAQASYQRDMRAIRRDTQQLPWTRVDNAIARVDQLAKFGTQDIKASAAAARDAIKTKIADWKALNPAQYHTPAGFDALKQSINDTLETIPYQQKAARKVVGDVYDAVKNTIIDKAPGYANTMKNYETFSNNLREIERELSTGSRANADTALRKLLSVNRNNASTNFGRRAQMVNRLQEAGAPQLGNKIVGADLSAMLPRGLVGRMVSSLGLGAGGLASMGTALAAAPLASPRVMGEAFHGLGSLQRLGNQYRPAVSALHAPGRIYVSPNRQGQ